MNAKGPVYHFNNSFKRVKTDILNVSSIFLCFFILRHFPNQGELFLTKSVLKRIEFLTRVSLNSPVIYCLSSFSFFKISTILLEQFYLLTAVILKQKEPRAHIMFAREEGTKHLHVESYSGLKGRLAPVRQAISQGSKFKKIQVAFWRLSKKNGRQMQKCSRQIIQEILK